MEIWFAFAALAVLTLAALVWPLLGRSVRMQGGTDADIYAAQLAEVEVERDRGLLTDTDAVVARSEVARRLLRAHRTAVDAPRANSRRWLAAAGVAIFVPAFSAGAYLSLGAPRYGDMPLSARLPPDDATLTRLAADAEARLGAAPEDGEGWAALGPVYLRLQRFDDAARVFAEASARLGDRGDLIAGRAQALTFASGGAITDEARTLFTRAMELQPEDARPAIFLAIAARQRGDLREAGRLWQQLLLKSTGTEEWLEIANTEFALLAEASGWKPGMGGDAADELVGLDPGALAPGAATPVIPQPGAAPVAAAGGRPGDDANVAGVPNKGTGPASGAVPSARPLPDQPGAPLPGPSEAAIAAAGAMAPGAQQAMVEGMVARLAGRLAGEGGSVEEWVRLVRAYRVLGREDDARATAQSAMTRLPEGDRTTLAATEGVADLLR